LSRHIAPVRPPFNLVYNGGFDFNLFDNTAESVPPAFDLTQTVFIPPSHPYHPSETAKILTIPLDLESPYSVQIKSGDILDVMECDLLPHDPTNTHDTTNLVLTLPWIRDEARTTLFIPELMKSPKQGVLLKDNSDSWSFHPGRSLKEKSL